MFRSRTVRVPTIRAAALMLMAALLCGLPAVDATAASGIGATALARTHREVRPPVTAAAPGQQRSTEYVPAGDELITGTGDADGYHLFAATNPLTRPSCCAPWRRAWSL